MKNALFIIVAFAVTGLGWAQGDCNPDNCWTVTDATCYNEWDCSTMNGASDGIAFQVSCTGEYTFVCKLGDCSNSECQLCLACAKLTRNSGTVPESWYCSVGCSGSCTSGGQSVTLYAGLWYSMQVSLKHCGEDGCVACDCVAKARLYGDSGDCTAW